MPDVRVRAMGPPGKSVRAGKGRMSVSRRPQPYRGSGRAYVWRHSHLPRRAAIVLWIAAFSLGWAVTAASTQIGLVAARSRSTPVAAAVTMLSHGADPNSPALPVGHRGWGTFGKGVDRTTRGVAWQKVRQNPVFADVRGLALRLPHPSPVLVAFHEASKPEALALDPVGHLLMDDNPGEFTPVLDKPGPAYQILSSRGRGRPATSAVDIVVSRGALITAPVSGRVVEVRKYPLYGRTLDWRVAIAPARHPGLQVVLIHLEQPRVAVGDEVVTSVTPLGTVRLLNFISQVDYVTNQHLPHTHIEVKLAVDA